MVSKYSVGIDLGTTNSVLAYAPLDVEHASIQVLPIEQVVAANQIEARDGLPSFLYLPDESEVASAALMMPGGNPRDPVVGTFARHISSEQPDRTIAAAKSWLSYAKVDRKSAILPWGAGSEVAKLSPVDVSQAILRHLVNAWHRQFPDARLNEQLVTLTVPASFDVVARDLTREAALAAGLPEDFILLEEPQAAVYHWLATKGEAWRRAVGERDLILVVDVGGGTTDLTLVRVEQEAGELVLRRLAVGDHLLVGGDNMDVALAHYVAGRFKEKGMKLNAWQAVSLWHACRRAKESLLSDSGKETESIALLGRGSRLVGGTVTVDVERSEVQHLLVDGFFPSAQPMRGHSANKSLAFKNSACLTKPTQVSRDMWLHSWRTIKRNQPQRNQPQRNQRQIALSLAALIYCSTAVSSKPLPSGNDSVKSSPIGTRANPLARSARQLTWIKLWRAAQPIMVGPNSMVACAFAVAPLAVIMWASKLRAWRSPACRDLCKPYALHLKVWKKAHRSMCRRARLAWSSASLPSFASSLRRIASRTALARRCAIGMKKNCKRQHRWN